MVEIGADPFVIADSTRLVVAQRLVRKLCRECSVPAKPPKKSLDAAREVARRGGLAARALDGRFRKAVGCRACNHTGYKGRTVVAEALAMSTQIGVALRRGASVDQLRTLAVGQGMTTMAADGFRRAAAGETTIEEVARVVGQGSGKTNHTS
jgi:type II secretory ATPase GspE/PulE/Tfp pilus assembly ATPase PilB-like protein